MRAVVLSVIAPLVVLVLAPGFLAADPAAAGPAFTAANGKFTCVVEPGTNDRPARLRVFEGDPGRAGATPKWERNLPGAAPVEVLVSDDGHHAVTLGERRRPRDEVVSVYIAGRRAFGWSLDEVLLPADLRALAASPLGWQWGRRSVELLVDFNGRRYLAVWFAVLGRWQVWDLTVGQPLAAPTPPLADRCNTLARGWALANVERRGDERVTAVKFLGFLRDGRDRALVERQLSAEDDYQSTEHSFNDALHRFMGFSETRKAADAALAAWDGRKAGPVVPSAAARAKAQSLPQFREQRQELRKKIAEHYHLDPSDRKAAPLRAAGQLVAQEQAMLAQYLEQRDDERYVCLGVVDVTVRLPERPARGSLWVYLVPEAVAPSEWATNRPVHRLRAAFNDAPPTGYPTAVPVRFEGVTPGRYWVKAVYDCAEPFSRDGAAACTPSPGDYESTQRAVVEAVAGKVSSPNPLDCTTRCETR
jgi:hypothetical protein